MHKKLKKWVIAAAALVTVAAVGVTLAFMFKKANVKTPLFRRRYPAPRMKSWTVRILPKQRQKAVKNRISVSKTPAR